MKTRLVSALVILGCAVSGNALAQADVVIGARSGVVDEYTAYIGADDLYSSSGVRLTSPSQILRQDRANFHRFGLRQRGDTGDSFFASSANRARFERMLQRGRISGAARNAIVSGGAVVRVEIWGRGSTGDYVFVEVF